MQTMGLSNHAPAVLCPPADGILCKDGWPGEDGRLCEGDAGRAFEAAVFFVLLVLLVFWVLLVVIKAEYQARRATHAKPSAFSSYLVSPFCLHILRGHSLAPMPLKSRHVKLRFGFDPVAAQSLE